MQNLTAVRPEGIKPWSPEEKSLIKETVAKGATDTELEWFFRICQARGLNPFTKEVWFIKRGSTPTIQVSIDGLRLIAHRTGKLRGIRRGIETQDGKIIGWAEVYREGWTLPAREEVDLSEYKTLQNSLWRQMPLQMLKKCAEAQALRMAFSENMGGLYTHEELDQADRQPAVELQDAREDQEEFEAVFSELLTFVKTNSVSQEEFSTATGIDSLHSIRDAFTASQAKADLERFLDRKEL